MFEIIRLILKRGGGSEIGFSTLTWIPIGGGAEVARLNLKRGKIHPKVTELIVVSSNPESRSSILTRPNKKRPVPR